MSQSNYRYSLVKNDEKNILAAIDTKQTVTSQTIQNSDAPKPDSKNISNTTTAINKILNDSIKQTITCPITLSIFRDPVTLPDSGRVVERAAAKKLTEDPFTRKPFAYSENMKKNITVSQLVDDYLKMHPEEQSQQYESEMIAPEAKADPPLVQQPLTSTSSCLINTGVVIAAAGCCLGMSALGSTAGCVLPCAIGAYTACGTGCGGGCALFLTQTGLCSAPGLAIAGTGGIVRACEALNDNPRPAAIPVMRR